MNQRTLRNIPGVNYSETKKSDGYEHERDIIVPERKIKFDKNHKHIGNDKLLKMYLVRLYYFNDKKYHYKVTLTDKKLYQSLIDTNKRYKCDYDITLIEYYYVSHNEDGKRFHDMNESYLIKYVDDFGRKDKTLYKKSIIKIFEKYGIDNNFNDL
jgi:hypothetical protein